MKAVTQTLHKTGEKLRETLKQVRGTTMQSSEKVQSCFDVRLGSLVVGVIMAVISGFAVLACIGGFIYVNVFPSLGYDYDTRRFPKDYGGLLPKDASTSQLEDVITMVIVHAVLTFGLIFSLLEFSFSVVLADGASKRKTSHLKAYFIYGTVKSALTFIVSIVRFIISWDVGPGNVILPVCAINILMTMMVYMAYKSIKKSAKRYDQLDNEVPVKE